MNAAFEYDDLVHRYLDGLCSETEAAVLFSALAKSTDLQEMFQRAVRLQTILRETASSYVAPADLASRVMQSVGLDPVPAAALASAASTSQTKLGRFFIPLLALSFFAAGTLSSWFVLYPSVMERKSVSSSGTIQAELSKVPPATETQGHTSLVPDIKTTMPSSILHQTQTSSPTSKHSVLSATPPRSNATAYQSVRRHDRISASASRQHVYSAGVQQTLVSQQREAIVQVHQLSVEAGSISLGALAHLNQDQTLSNTAKVQSAHQTFPSTSQAEEHSIAMASTIGSDALASLASAPTNSAAPAISTLDKTGGAASVLPNSLRCSLSALATRSANVAGANTAPLTQDFQLRDWSVGCLWNLNSWLDLGVIAGNEYLPLYAVTTTQNGTTYKLENSRPWIALNSQVHFNLDGSISDKSDWQWLGAAHAGLSNAGTHLGFSFGIAHSLTNNIHIALSPEYRLQFLSDANSQYRANRLGIDIALFYTL